MFLVKVGDESVLAEDFEVVGFGDADEVFQFGLDLCIPIFVIVQIFQVQGIAE